MNDFQILIAERDLNWQEKLTEEITKALREVGCQEQDYSIKITKTYGEAVQALNNSQWNLLITDIAGLSGADQTKEALAELIGQHLIILAHQRQTPTIAISGYKLPIRKVRDMLKDQNYDLVDFFDKTSFDNNQFIAIVKKLWQQQNSARFKAG